MDKNQLINAINTAYEKFKDIHDGDNASYIPFLAQVPAELTGLCFVSVTGEVHTVGDTDYSFAIESISKVITLALALKQHGAKEVHDKIGADATGLPFNSVMALELHNDKPLSPLVNAGAMATTSLIKADGAEDRWQQILSMQSAMAGSQIMLSKDVNDSEQMTNTHNKAIALLLQSSGSMYSDPFQACDVYTRQCSTLYNCVELATTGACLANGGVNPVSGETILSADLVPRLLAEMMTEGLYERSGDWAFEVGLPGKSGVGGGLLAVIPNVGALAAFSPPLDVAGNSVRGQLMIKSVANDMNWNLFNSVAH
ncbi:glutaminase A [Aliivibrio finisterrensis]|uniref:Glutaminase n=1 Tax=Aliivibrio finisterrensis TaxID=511998 RepID=A0A6N6RTR6_9GAMM|nr:glutaminase A [Aliivibrio finisterrensis]KAB2825052.1 glutaminase A [Aliivibrio finisterrensis]